MNWMNRAKQLLYLMLYWAKQTLREIRSVPIRLKNYGILFGLTTVQNLPGIWMVYNNWNKLVLSSQSTN